MHDAMQQDNKQAALFELDYSTVVRFAKRCGAGAIRVRVIDQVRLGDLELR